MSIIFKINSKTYYKIIFEEFLLIGKKTTKNVFFNGEKQNLKKIIIFLFAHSFFGVFIGTNKYKTYQLENKSKDIQLE